RLGYHPFRQAAAITSREYKGRPACSYCGFCTTGYGCWNDSKSSTLVTTIAAAEKTGKLEIRPRSRVLEILTDKDGRASGVKYLDSKGHAHVQPAGLVILATYVYENNRLLLLSTSKAHPNGLLNNNGMVGKYYRTQVGTSVNGLFPGKNLNLWGGTASQATVMDDLNGDNFDHGGLGFIRGASIQVGTNNMPISQAVNVPPTVPVWGSAYKQWLQQNINSVGAAFAQMETLSYESNVIDLDPVKKDDLGIPVTRLTYSIHENENNMGEYLTGKLTKLLLEAGASETWGGGPPTLIPVYSHAYGGTVMGGNPDTSVVNKYSLAHEVPNLAVMGGSTFVNVTGYNPTETIQALAWYASDHIAKHYHSIAA
ncbi:MAG: GMC oxidoreductase, partial [Conexibacteraceae bacterium]|nr:GMC oxidoreductase [Conexibacteraceae bacterium]